MTAATDACDITNSLRKQGGRAVKCLLWLTAAMRSDRLPARELCPKFVYIFRTIFPLGMIALALSGCVTTRYAPVYCVTPTQLDRLKAAEPPRVGEKLTGQAQDDFKIAAGSAIQLRSWGEGVLGVLEGCTGK